MAERGRYILALDEGTTGTTAMLVDRRGRPVAQGYQEITQHYPRPGWVEHDAEEIWRKTVRSVRVAMRRAHAQGRDVAAIGITNQRETLVTWDARSGRPLAPAIVWQCRRTADLCQKIKRQGLESMVRTRTGLLLDPYFSGSKLRWYLENHPKVRRARRSGSLRFGTIDSWLAWKLTGGRLHVTDASNASRTLLFNLRGGRYDGELLRLFRAREEELPRVVDSSGLLGETDARILGRPVPIAGIAGDQQAALFGQACFKPGMAKNTYGTGCFALINTGSSAAKPPAGILSTVAWRIGGRTSYALEGAVFIAGAVVQWLRDGLGVIERSSETAALARRAGPDDDLVLVPAFVGLGAPHWDPYARGLLVGITRGTGVPQLARAALESIAFQSADVVAALEQAGGRRVPRLRVDGGAAANDYLLQFQADVLGIPVDRAKVQGTTALGAAYLAGLGSGFWDSTRQLSRQWALGRRFEPVKSPAWRSRRVERWDAAVRRSLGWAARK